MPPNCVCMHRYMFPRRTAWEQTLYNYNYKQHLRLVGQVPAFLMQIPHCKFHTRPKPVHEKDFYLYGGSSIREASFPRHTNCELYVKKSSQHWNLYKTNIF